MLEKYKKDRIKIIYLQICELYAYKYRKYFQFSLENSSNTSELFAKKYRKLFNYMAQ